MTTTLPPDIDPNIISVNPKIVSGQPAFPGTRVMVYLLRDYLMDGLSIDDFLEAVPTVSREQVLNVLQLAFDRTIGPTED